MGEKLDAKDIDAVLQQVEEDGVVSVEKLVAVLTNQGE